MIRRNEREEPVAKMISGRLEIDALRKLVASGDIDTVVTVFPDLYGRLVGKRNTGRFFVENILEHAMFACDYLLACDMEMDPVQGYRFTSWAKGYGDLRAVPDLGTLRVASWLDRTALVICDVYEETSDDDEEVTTGSGGASQVDPALFEMLKDLRRKVAKEKGLPPFVIFLENSLEDMAISYPTTLEELEKIQGVSKGKAIRYGKKFVELIEKYVEENDIVKPDDFVMKSVVNKSGMKVFIIQNIDKKIPLDTIARNKGLSLQDLLLEMETIVASGTKLNLDYCLEQELDEDEQEDIFDYFRGSQDDNLESAYEEFKGNNVSIEHLQMMRIKFLSEYGN